ncbi:MAG: hypothetical protein ACRDD7_13785 [Peptostreptococcaceae bacterium]
MKLKIILIVSLLSIFITGCSSQEEISLVEEGKLALEKSEYKKAKEILSEALEEDSTDDNARAMYMQAVKMEKVIEYEEDEDYKRAINELEVIDGIKNGLSSIKSKVPDKKEELIKLNEEYENAMLQRKENAKSSASKDIYRVKKLASKEMENILAKEAEQKRKEEEKKKQEEANKEEQIPQVQPEQPKPEVPSTDVVISPTSSAQW